MGSRRLTAVLTALIAAAAVVGGGVSAASASGTTLPGLTGFGHMAVDGANGHVFVDGASTDSNIDVMNEDGTSAGSITGETGAGGMVLDGSTLYVARCANPGTIDTIDTSTLTVTGSIPIPSPGIAGRCSLAEANGQLWFSNSTDQQFGHLTAVSLDSSHTITTTSVNKYQMLLASVPGHPDWLVLGESDSDPGQLMVEDVSTPSTPSTVATVEVPDVSDLRDLAVTSDGSQVDVGVMGGIQAYNLPDLTQAGWYPTPESTTSVAASPAGQIAGGENLASSGAAFLFDAGDAQPRTSWPLSSSSDAVYTGGLAFNETGGTLFAVSHGSGGSSVVFNALSTSAPAATPTVTGFSHMLVDPTGHVFITGSRASSAIDVFNPDGTAAGTIDNESGAGGMVLDGSTLYVARCRWGVIDEIDTDTLALIGSIQAPVGGTCDLAEANNRLWFSDSIDHQWGYLSSVALSSPHTVIKTTLRIYQGIFAAIPGHPTWVAMGGTNSFPATVSIQNISNPASPVQVSSKFDPGGGGGDLADLTPTHSGDQLLMAASAPNDVQTFDDADLSIAHSYPTGSFPDAVALSPSGGQVVGGSESGTGPDVYLFNAGGTAKLTDWSFPTAELLYPRGLAFSADGSHIYAVTAGASDAGPVLHVLSTIVLPKGSVSLTRSLGTVTYGKGDTLTAHLGTSTSSRTLQVFRTPATGGTPVLVHTGTAGPKGNISLLVHPAVDSIYTVKWNGDSQHAAATASVRVNVRLAMHAVTKGGYRTLDGVRLYHYATSCVSAKHTGCPVFLAWAGPAQPSRNINVVVQGRTASGRWVTILHGTTKTGTSGRLLLTIFYSSKALENVPQRIRFSMATSTANLGATSAWVHFRITA
jgi:hypothetical protein